MNQSEKLSHELHDIKQMMERSSRFISLSGLSGISAGVCALIGAWFGNKAIRKTQFLNSDLKGILKSPAFELNDRLLYNHLLQIAIITFIAAFASAFIFTYRRSKKTNVPIWGRNAKRLMVNVCIPMVTGGIFLLMLMQNSVYGFVAPGCLIFYGLGLINASKYTLIEIRYLGYGEIILGLISLAFINYGLYFWVAGFGILHIIYGIFMWMKYEKS